MDKTEIEKSKPFFINEVLEYKSGVVIMKNIMEKITGKVTAFSFDKGQALGTRVLAYDTFLMVIDGKAELNIDHTPIVLNTWESIIVPAHRHHGIKAPAQFKMLQILIKSGYEEVI